MKTTPQPAHGIASETRELYLHLLNLKREDGEPATDPARLHREISESPNLRGTFLDAAALARYIAGDQEISADHMEALRVALDHAHRQAVDPRYTWKPRWLNGRQGIRHAHPSIANQSLALPPEFIPASSSTPR
jgi:hypothetical protein